MTEFEQRGCVCPGCERQLKQLKFIKERIFRCPSCRSLWLWREQDTQANSNQADRNPSTRLIELDTSSSPNRCLRKFSLLWSIVTLLKFVLPIPALMLGLTTLILSFYRNGQWSFSPLLLLMALSLVVLGVHTFLVGRSLRRLEADSIAILNRYIILASLSGLLISIGFTYGFADTGPSALRFMAVVFLWMAFFHVPLAVLYIYVRVSKSIRATFLTWETKPAESQR